MPSDLRRRNKQVNQLINDGDNRFFVYLSVIQNIVGFFNFRFIYSPSFISLGCIQWWWWCLVNRGRMKKAGLFLRRLFFFLVPNQNVKSLSIIASCANRSNAASWSGSSCSSTSLSSSAAPPPLLSSNTSATNRFNSSSVGPPSSGWSSSTGSSLKLVNN